MKFAADECCDAVLVAGLPCEHRMLDIKHPTLNDASLRCSAFDVGGSMFNPVLVMSEHSVGNKSASEWLTLERHFPCGSRLD